MSLRKRGYCIVGQKEHTDELAALLLQYGIACWSEAEGVLRFDPNVDQARVEELLESYKHVKGS